jgi:MYXO-CTERM domain-containing protein
MRMNQFTKTLLLCGLAGASASAMAAGTWNFSTCNGTASNQQATNSGNFGNTWVCSATAGTGTITATAWGGIDAAGSTGFQTAYLSPQGASGFGTASKYEGLNPPSPDHAVDNQPANSTPDLVLLKFNTAVILDKIAIGWSQSDADITVMAYTGALAPASFLQGKNASNLTTGGAGAGWALIQNAGDADPATAGGTSPYSVNAAGISSSYWLISAYSSSYGGGSLDSTLDYVKLLSVATRDAAQTTSVPEPGSLALAAAALLGAVRVRRRSKS